VLQLQSLHDLSPVSFPDQGGTTVSPPVSVHAGCPHVAGPEHVSFPLPDPSAVQIQSLHHLSPVSSPDQGESTVSPPVKVHTGGGPVLVGSGVGVPLHLLGPEHLNAALPVQSAVQVQSWHHLPAVFFPDQGGSTFSPPASVQTGAPLHLLGKHFNVALPVQSAAQVQSWHHLPAVFFPDQGASTVSPPVKVHAGVGVLGGPDALPGNQPATQAGGAMHIGDPNKWKFSPSVHVLTPSRHEQVLHELLPVSVPDQPLRTVPPPAKVHSFSAGVDVVTMTTGGGKIDVAVAWANRVATIDGGVALVPSGPGVFLKPTSSSAGPDDALVGDGLSVLVGVGLGELVGDGLGVLVGDGVLVRVTVSGTIQGPMLLHPNTPLVHEHALQKLSPVSFPDQPCGTVSPPNKVHVRTKVAVLVGVLVAVGGTGVAVGCTGIAVRVAVGGTGVLVGGTSVGVAVDVGVGVLVGVEVLVGVGVGIVNVQVFETRLVSKDASVATPAATVTDTVPVEEPFSTSNV